MVTSTVCRTSTRPWPRQCGHGSSTTRPSPRHCGQAAAVVTWPKIDCMVRRTCPAPWHVGHCFASVPARAPLPWHSSHWPARGTSMVRLPPNTTSSNVISMFMRRSAPRCGPLRPRRRPAPPPKNMSKRSKAESKENDPKSGGMPPAACPNASYRWRLSGSLSTEYASPISLNRSSAALSPSLRSG